jgi:hypothetical protein
VVNKVVKIQDNVSWVATPCSVVAEHQCFRRPCCFHLHFTLKMEAANSPEKLVSYQNTAKYHLQKTLT